MYIMLVAFCPWSSSTAILSGGGSGPVEVCTDEIRYLFSGDLPRFQWQPIVGC